MSRAVSRIGYLLMMGVLLLVLAACGGQTEQSVSTATPEAGTGALHAMAPVKAATSTAEPAATSTAEPAATLTAESATTNTPRPTNTRVLPQTPMATVNPNRLTRADIARIEVAEAKARLDAGEAIMVDVRSAAAYEFSHISGALSMPGTEVAKRTSELDGDKLVIFY